jgi:hypothetical protein
MASGRIRALECLYSLEQIRTDCKRDEPTAEPQLRKMNRSETIPSEANCVDRAGWFASLQVGSQASIKAKSIHLPNPFWSSF